MTDPESLDEVRDPIAEDEVEVVETGDLNEREEGEETVGGRAEENVDSVDDSRPDLESDEIGVTEADGPEVDT